MRARPITSPARGSLSRTRINTIHLSTGTNRPHLQDFLKDELFLSADPSMEVDLMT